MGACPECGKMRYTSKGQAKRAGRQTPRRRGKLRVYRCGAYWHLTSQATAKVTMHRERDAEPGRP